MDRVLLLMTTATYKASAFLDAAARLGAPVVVGSERPQALEKAAPGGTVALDFSAPEDAVRTIVDFARQSPIRAVVSADDEGSILAVMASVALGLPHNPVEAVAAARNKHRMREILAKTDIRSPRFERFSSDDDPEGAARMVSYPCVLKPLSLSASRGVIRADDPDQFVAAFRRVRAILLQSGISARGAAPQSAAAGAGQGQGSAARGVEARGGAPARTILVEAFIPGNEVALEGLLTRGMLKVLAIFDKPDPLDGPFFEETIYVTPSRLPASTQDAVAACTAHVAAALGLREGPVHAELRVNEKEPWIIEIAPRSIGGLCARTLRFDSASSRGVSLEELILRHALGFEVERFERERRAAGVMMIPIPRAGILREVRGQERAREVPGVEEIRFTIPVGQQVVPPPEGAKYLGFIFARNDAPAAVEGALREAHGRLSFAITPP